MSGPRQVVTIAWIAAWVFILAIGLAYIALIQVSSGDSVSTLCEAEPGSSNFGRGSWSVLPPGRVCTFTEEENGFSEIRGPNAAMSLWLAYLAVGAGVTIFFVRSQRVGSRSTLRTPSSRASNSR